MPRTFDDIDALVGRLRSVARQIDPHQPQTEPPPFAYRHRLNELMAGEGARENVSNPRHPRFEELFAPELDDEAFVDRAYRLLMGRAADADGMSHYLALLPRSGRLYVLANLLCADETRTRLAESDVTIPRRGALTLPFRIAGKFGPLSRAIHVLMRPAYRLTAIAIRPRMRLMSRLVRIESREHLQGALVSDILVELDGEIQRLQSAMERRDTDQQGLADHVEQHRQRLEEYCESLAQHQDHLAQHQDSLTRQDHRLQHQQDQLQQQQRQVTDHQRYQASLWSALQHHRRAVEQLMAAPEQVSEEPQKTALLSRELEDAYYLAFEEACRGSEDAITKRLRQYQPQLDVARQAGSRALDMGCGRGEWLTLLKDQGFEPHGVDLNVSMVDHCHEAGLEVELGDVIDCLRRQPDDSHALISGFHIAEHLPFDVLYTLVDEARRILAPGGMLLLETPNPENVLVGSHTFYHDHTHHNPLTPTALSFLLTYHGFADIEVLRLNPYPEEAKVPGDDPLTARVNGHLCGPQDFAAVGVKSAPAAREDEPTFEPESEPEARA